MSIPETRKKIHFASFTPKKEAAAEETVPTVVVSKKYGTIQFSAGLMRETGMDGKFVKMYYDAPRKIIGWQIKSGMSHGALKSWKLVKANINGNFVLGIGRILQNIPGLTQDSYKKLPVQKYKEMGTFDEHSGETFYFVELKDPGEKEEETNPQSHVED